VLDEQRPVVGCVFSTTSAAVESISIRRWPPVLAEARAARRGGDVASIRSHRLNDRLAEGSVIPADG
jgi:hypothetical protein